MLDEQEKEELKTRLSILDVVAHDGLTVVQRGNKYSTQEHDSLILYPATNSWSWFSQADQRGKTLGGDIFAWYMHNHRCNFTEAHNALSAMAGTLPPATVAQARREQRKSKTSTDSHENKQFAEDAWNLLQTAEGEPVAVYLAGRGISLDAAKRWGLGAAYHESLGWMVVMPYRLSETGEFVYNSRVISGKKTFRHSIGQRGGLFGARLAQPSKERYLFAVEAELNAVSIGIACDGMDVDAVSFGNKSISDAARQQLVTLATGYQRLIVWTDDAPDTQKILKSVPGAIGYKSKILDGKKMDANEMLQQGILGDYIAVLIERHNAPVAIANAAPVATIGDLCGYVGQDVDGATWQALQAECTRRYGSTWHFDASASGDGWHVTRLHATHGG